MLDVGCWILDVGYTGCRRKHWLLASKLNQPSLAWFSACPPEKCGSGRCSTRQCEPLPCVRPRWPACHWIFLELSIVFRFGRLDNLGEGQLVPSRCRPRSALR